MGLSQGKKDRSQTLFTLCHFTILCSESYRQYVSNTRLLKYGNYFKYGILRITRDESKEEGIDQESIQSSTTPEPESQILAAIFNAEKVTHIKGRLLDQAMILFNCVPFQNGNFS